MLNMTQAYPLGFQERLFFQGGPDDDDYYFFYE